MTKEQLEELTEKVENAKGILDAINTLKDFKKSTVSLEDDDDYYHHQVKNQAIEVRDIDGDYSDKLYLSERFNKSLQLDLNQAIISVCDEHIEKLEKELEGLKA